jgi:hypothetical protein
LVHWLQEVEEHYRSDDITVDEMLEMHRHREGDQGGDRVGDFEEFRGYVAITPPRV